MAKFIVKERDYLGFGRKSMYGKQAMQFSPWRNFLPCSTIEEARAARTSRNTGLFQRAVFYKGHIVIDRDGREDRKLLESLTAESAS